jgi:hypothetical protein
VTAAPGDSAETPDPAIERRYRIAHGAAGVGLVLNEDQFDLLLDASELGWDAVVAALALIRTENQR